MITNKERLEKLIEEIKRLAVLTEEIRERDVYPVSFFSQAFDLTNKILEDLQQIEIFQIELIANQVKEHQTQILSTVRQPTNTVKPENTIPVLSELSIQPEPEIAPVHADKPAISVEPAVIQPPQLFSQQEMVAHSIVPPPVHHAKEEKKMIPAYSPSVRKNRIDLKKVITLNDRFLFCRELFANNENLMNQTLNELNMNESYDVSFDYLQKRFDWNFEDKNVVDFITILKKSFS